MTRFPSSSSSHPSHSPRHTSWLRGVDQWSGWLVGVGLLGAAVLLFTLHLGNVPLRDWDEGLVAQVAKEMAESPFSAQIWLHPTLQGEPYFNKPPFVHWLVAIAYAFGGIHEWTARLPGALATACSVPMLYLLARDMFPQRMRAVLATWVYLTLLPVVRHGRLAMLDGMVLCAFLGLLVCALRSRRRPRWSLGIGLCFSILCLTKGILGLSLMAIALLFLMVDAPRLFRSVQWWVGIIIGCIPLILWYAAQGFYYGYEFWDAHLLQQSLNRTWETVEQNSGPPWYYLLELLKYSWPWLIFLPMGMKAVWSDRTLSWAKLVTIWGGSYFLLISAMGTKLPWYIMPLYPALALVIGSELYRLWQTLPGASIKLAPSRTYRGIITCFLGFIAIVGWAGALYLGSQHFGGDLGGVSESATPLDWSLVRPLAVLGLTMTAALMLLWRGDRQFISILLWGFYLCLLLFVSSNHWNWELGEDYLVKPVATMIQAAQHPQSEPTPSPPLAISQLGNEGNTISRPATVATLPDTPYILTSHPYHRPSLNFYSGHVIYPVEGSADEKLKTMKRQWRTNPSLALLLDNDTFKRLNLKRVQVLGKAENFVLIRRQKKRSKS